MFFSQATIGKKHKKHTKTNILLFLADIHTYKLTFVSFFLFFYFAPFPKINVFHSCIPLLCSSFLVFQCVHPRVLLVDASGSAFCYIRNLCPSFKESFVAAECFMCLLLYPESFPQPSESEPLSYEPELGVEPYEPPFVTEDTGNGVP